MVNGREHIIQKGLLVMAYINKDWNRAIVVDTPQVGSSLLERLDFVPHDSNDYYKVTVQASLQL